MGKKGSFDSIRHEGTVKRVGNGSVLVSIISGSACSGCHAENLCSISGKEEKLIDIKGTYNVSPGDSVTVMMNESMGLKAVLLSYIIPLIVILSGLIAFSSLPVSEPVAGLLALSLLLPYFIILYLLRKKIDRSFTFTLKLQ